MCCELRQFKLLDDKVCISRTLGGEVIAREDTFPHRKLPLFP